VNSSDVTQTPQSNQFTDNRWTPSGVNYDAAGNQTSIYLGAGGTRSFTYDAENRQITATIPGMSAISYVYDGDGRRVQKTVGSTVTTYIYDAQGDLAEELGGPANPLAGQTTYLTSDHLGSTRAVTSASGSPLARYDYAPFGDELNVGTDGRTTPFLNNFYPVPTSDGTDPKFTSKERDSESGLDFFWARYYSSPQGRFTGPDEPLVDQYASDPQSWNLYSYVRNNPLKFTDPSGLDCVYLGAAGSSGPSVTVETGGCSQFGGIYVNGTVDTNSFSYDATVGELILGTTAMTVRWAWNRSRSLNLKTPACWRCDERANWPNQA